MAGAVGQKGEQGATGSQGTKGDTGAVGVAGAAGSQGAKGAVGPKGATGATGPQGPPGLAPAGTVLYSVPLCMPHATTSKYFDVSLHSVHLVVCKYIQVHATFTSDMLD